MIADIVNLWLFMDGKCMQCYERIHIMFHAFILIRKAQGRVGSDCRQSQTASIGITRKVHVLILRI